MHDDQAGETRNHEIARRTVEVACALQPRISISEKRNCEHSENSIEVYALNRSELVNERYERVLVVEKSIHTIRKLAQALQGSVDSKVSNIIRDLISYDMTALRALREDKQPYALLARQLTDQFFASADGLPEALKN